MAGMIRRARGRSAAAVAGWVGTSFVALASVAGCGSGNAGPDRSGAPTVAVTFRGDALAGVQVSLYDEPDGPPLVRAVTREDGKAYFTDVPSPEPLRYRVDLESLGDAAWMLDPKVIEPFCQGQTLDPLEQSPSQQLALPDRAVRPLDPGINR